MTLRLLRMTPGRPAAAASPFLPFDPGRLHSSFFAGPGGCCPTVSVSGANSTASCPGAEPLGTMPICPGTSATVQAKCKLGNMAIYENMMIEV